MRSRLSGVSFFGLLLISGAAFGQPDAAEIAKMIKDGNREAIEFLQTLQRVEDSGVRIFGNANAQAAVNAALRIHHTAAGSQPLSSNQIQELQNRIRSLVSPQDGALLQRHLGGSHGVLLQNQLVSFEPGATPEAEKWRKSLEARRLGSGRYLSEADKAKIRSFLADSSYYRYALRSGDAVGPVGFAQYMANRDARQGFKAPKNRLSAVGAAVLAVLQEASLLLKVKVPAKIPAAAVSAPATLTRQVLQKSVASGKR